MSKKVKEKNLYSWDSVNGVKYWRIIDALQNEGDEITKQAELISIIEDIDIDDVLNMSLQESASKVKSLIFLNEFQMKEYRSLKTIVMGGKTYDVISDMSKMTTASFIDYQTYIKLPFRDSYDKILSCFIIPAGFIYNDGYDVMEVQELIRTELSWCMIQSILSFLLARYAKSFNRSRAYLAKSIRMEKDPMKRAEMESKMKDMDLQIKIMVHQLQHLTGSV